MDSSIVISGYGIICSTGMGISAFKNALYEGKTGISGQSLLPPLTFPGSGIQGKLKNFSLDEALKKFSHLPLELLAKIKKILQRAPLSIQTSVFAALEAFEQAHFLEESQRPSKCGLVIAGSNISQKYQYESYQAFHKAPDYLSPSYALNFLDTNLLGILSDIFRIKDAGFTVGGASASGNVGIAQAYQQIKTGLLDACIVVGALVDLSPVELQGFHNIGALGGQAFADTPEKACRPFDKNRDGFIYGQGAGCLILEKRQTSMNRGVTPLGAIMGATIVLDGNRLSNPSQEGESRAMRQALADAGLSPSDIQYINAHATASTLGDEVEIKAIKEVFGSSETWINSTKSITGHCLGAAGTIEAIATLIQMKEGFVHPNLNLDDPIDDTLRFSRKQSEPTIITYALSNGFGFGGINTSIILGRSV